MFVPREVFQNVIDQVAFIKLSHKVVHVSNEERNAGFSEGKKGLNGFFLFPGKGEFVIIAAPGVILQILVKPPLLAPPLIARLRCPPGSAHESEDKAGHDCCFTGEEFSHGCWYINRLFGWIACV